MCGKVFLVFETKEETSLNALSLYSILLAASAEVSFRQQPHHRPHQWRSFNNFLTRKTKPIYKTIF